MKRIVDPAEAPSSDVSLLRRSPQQARGARRVTTLLDAAAAVIARDGLGGATAEAIAREARTAKGSLYQFFPNSDAIVSALAARYANELAMIYAAAFGEADGSDMLPQLVDRVVLPLAAFHDRNPAFRHVFEAARQARDADGTGRLITRLRQTVVERIDRLMLTLVPTLDDIERARHARVVQTMGQALLYLRAESPAEDRVALLRATRDALVRYVAGIIEAKARPTPRRRGAAAPRAR
jgi:AcrR family transcriptional regulator